MPPIVNAHGVFVQKEDEYFIILTVGRDLFLSPTAEGKRFRRYSGAAGGGEITLKVSVHSGRLRRPGNAVPTAGDCRCPPTGARGERQPRFSFPS